ncbi:MAG: MarR family transcriptional regulator [Kutzneria sp.]|nr:MarR family transcriptional regulator [Kutzneria sp.]
MSSDESPLLADLVEAVPGYPPGLLAELGRWVQAYQDAVAGYDAIMAKKLGVNGTDLRCLEILMMVGEAAPSVLSTRLALTTGSVTAMLDRLEKLGYLTRSPDPTDRRKSVIRATARAYELVRELHGPLLIDSANVVKHFTADELRVVTDFFRRNTEFQQSHTERVRALPTPKRPADQ